MRKRGYDTKWGFVEHPSCTECGGPVPIKNGQFLTNCLEVGPFHIGREHWDLTPEEKQQRLAKLLREHGMTSMGDCPMPKVH